MQSDKIFFIMQNCIKNLPFNWSIKFRSLLYKPFFKKFGLNIQIKDGVIFKYPSEIEIGDNVIVGEYSYLVGKSGLTIGKDVLIGAGSKIITSTHNFNNISEPMRNQGLSFESVIIEEDVWLGFDVKILAGSFVPKGCIIATNSVVNKKLEVPYAIYAGTPAYLKKMRSEKE